MRSTSKIYLVVATLSVASLLSTVVWSEEARSHEKIRSDGVAAMLATQSMFDPKALIQLKKLAQSGNGRAQGSLGFMYETGHPGVPVNKQQALFWYRKAVAQGDAGGQYHLGHMYFYGEGVVQDRVKAVSLFQKSAEQGDYRAQNMLANSYAAGLGIPQNYEYAAAWYSKAAERGIDNAQFMLGLHFAEGLGVEKDLTQSLKWLLIAKANKSDDAAKYLDKYRSEYSTKQTSQAQKLAAEWWLEHQPK